MKTTTVEIGRDHTIVWDEVRDVYFPFKKYDENNRLIGTEHKACVRVYQGSELKWSKN